MAQDLSLYCEEDRPLLQFYNAQGKLTGFTIDVVEEIQKASRHYISIQVVPWARGVEMLNHPIQTPCCSRWRGLRNEKICING